MSKMNSDFMYLGKIVTTLFLALLTVIALVGNIFVVLAIANFAGLRSKSCYQILAALAVADICVTLFVMPWSILYLTLDHWPLGTVFCHFWLSADVMCCTASILFLCLVALDRYISIAYPLHYPRVVSSGRLQRAIITIWVISAMISFLPIFLGWYRQNDYGLAEDVQNGTSVQNIHCTLKVNTVYGVISSAISFYIPFILFCFLYGRILVIAKKQNTQLHHIGFLLKQAPFHVYRRGQGINPFRWESNEVFKSVGDQQGRQIFNVDGQETSVECETVVNPESLSLYSRVQPGCLHSSIGKYSFQHKQSTASVLTNRSTIRSSDSSARLTSRSVTSWRNELKAVRTIGILLGSFTLCWLPFFVIYLLHAFCPSACQQPRIVEPLVTWIGYSNSAINPVLYSFFQRDFRAAYLRLLGQASQTTLVRTK